MLKIRLRRMGSTHSPFYRLVVSDARNAPTATAVDEVGYYKPSNRPPLLHVDTEKIHYWVGRGAKLSDTVRDLVKRFEKGLGKQTETTEDAASEETASKNPVSAAASTDEAGAEAAAEASADDEAQKDAASEEAAESSEASEEA